MGRIYKKSQNTIGWLGVDLEDNLQRKSGHEAIDFLHILAQYGSRLESYPSSEQGAAVQELNDPARWSAVEKLLLRAW
jgi:hypothetical protein